MIELVASTGNAEMDAYIKAIIGIYEATFPGRIRGYYLVGSYGDDTWISGSDIDMEILFKDAMTEDEIARCEVLKASCRTLAPIHLDLPVKSEANFGIDDTIALKLASKFVYGTDTRESIPLPSIEAYLRKSSAPAHRGLTVRFRQEVVNLPLSYPVPDDAYYGYVPNWYKADLTPIKLWVLNVGWLATFLVIHKAKVYVPSKRHMLRLYREHINDEWTDFVTQVYELGRNQWGYKFPADAKNLALFKSLCQQTLAFENYVADIYVDYLKEELLHGDKNMAEERLAAFTLP